jgi:hypothetical protein
MRAFQLIIMPSLFFMASLAMATAAKAALPIEMNNKESLEASKVSKYTLYHVLHQL